MAITLSNFAKALTSTILLGQAAIADCADCSLPKHTVRLSPSLLRKFAVSVDMPRVHQIAEGDVPREPSVFEILIYSDGTLCQIRESHDVDPRVRPLMEVAAKTWKFRAPLLHGKPVCTHSKLFVYLRNDHGTTHLVVPGLSPTGAKR
jgi:hypothetical protein